MSVAPSAPSTQTIERATDKPTCSQQLVSTSDIAENCCMCGHCCGIPYVRMCYEKESEDSYTRRSFGIAFFCCGGGGCGGLLVLPVCTRHSYTRVPGTNTFEFDEDSSRRLDKTCNCYCCILPYYSNANSGFGACAMSTPKNYYSDGTWTTDGKTCDHGFGKLYRVMRHQR
mgnify:CR=1 FL=1